MGAFPNFIAANLDFFNSDHRPVSINIEANPINQNGFYPKSFMFNHCWLLEDSYKAVLNDGWEYSRKAPNIHQALDRCSTHLKSWANVKVGSLTNKIKTVRQCLNDLNHEVVPEDRISEIVTLEATLENLLSKEEIYWNQRSRVKWLRLGGRNTTFFHKLASASRKRNHISGLRDAQNILHTD